MGRIVKDHIKLGVGERRAVVPGTYFMLFLFTSLFIFDQNFSFPHSSFNSFIYLNKLNIKLFSIIKKLDLFHFEHVIFYSGHHNELYILSPFNKP